MAELEQQAEAVSPEVEEKGAEVADQFAAADAAADPEIVDPPSVEEVAASIGWTPKDKFRGDPEKWKPADQFIVDGRKAERNMKRELDGLRSTLDTVSKTSAAIMQDKLREQAEALASRYEAAVERGDMKEAASALRQHDAVMAKSQDSPATRQPPSPETEQWAAKNARVFKDPLATQRAVELCEPYARANYAAADQLSAIEPILRREFPHLFDDKGPASVEAPRTRSSAPQKRGSTVADMPKEAQEIAKDMAERGLIKSPEDYARNYFAQINKG